jgi:hypothetical protein
VTISYKQTRDLVLSSFHSAKDPNIKTYSIFLYLPHDAEYKNTIKTVLTTQLSSMEDAGLPTSTAGLESM